MSQPSLDQYPPPAALRSLLALTSLLLSPFAPAQTAFESAVTADSPITWWRLGEASGTTAADSSTLPPLNFDGTYAGGVTLGVPGLVPGEPGTTAARFNGTNAQVNIASDPLINTSDHAARTIGLWFNADNPATATPQILFEEGGGTNGINLYVHDGELVAGAWRNNGPSNERYNEFLSTPIEPGTTYNAQLVFDRLNTSGDPNLDNPSGTNSLTLYLDGLAVAQAWVPSIMPTHAGQIAIAAKRNDTRFPGGASSGAGNRFAGSIAEVAQYNDGLTPQQIQAQWAAGGNASNNAAPAFNAYEQAVLDLDPSAFFRVGGANEATQLTTAGSGLGSSLSGILRGSTNNNTPALPDAPGLVPLGNSPSTRFTGGVSGIELPTDTAFHQTADRRSVNLWFNADSTSGRQVIYESGGNDRGFNAYILDGQLHLNAWNPPNDGTGSQWGGEGADARHIFTDIEAGQTYQLGIVLDGNGSATGSLIGYLDGTPFGQIGGVGRLYNHGNQSGIGRVFSQTRYHDIGTSAAEASFVGSIDDPSLHLTLANNLTPERIQSLYTAGTGLAPDHGAYGNAVLADDPIVYYHTGGVNVANSSNTTSGLGSAANVTPTASVAQAPSGTLIWDGSGGFRVADLSSPGAKIDIPNISGMNTGGPFPTRSYELLFGTTGDVITRQVLYDGGGNTNGFSAYIEDGELFMGVWANNNIIAYHSTPIEPNSRYHAAGVFDSTLGAGDDFFTSYLNGLLFDQTTGSFVAIPNHTDAASLGAFTGTLRFHDGTASGGGAFFDGLLGGFALYNSALTAQQIFAHAAAANIPEPTRALLLALALTTLLARRHRATRPSLNS